MSSLLGDIETRRAVARHRSVDDALRAVAERVLASINFVPITLGIAAAAAAVPPTALQTLDAIHLATIHSLRAESDLAVIYDVRLADAARASGVEVIAPI